MDTPTSFNTRVTEVEITTDDYPMRWNDPNWRQGQTFGTMTAVELRAQLIAFSPTVDGSLEGNLYFKGACSRIPGKFESLLDAFAALIEDPSMTYRQKAEDFMEWSIDDHDAEEYFRELWQQIADGRPYPLDEQGSSPGTPPDEQKK